MFKLMLKIVVRTNVYGANVSCATAVVQNTTRTYVDWANVVRTNVVSTNDPITILLEQMLLEHMLLEKKMFEEIT